MTVQKPKKCQTLVYLITCECVYGQFQHPARKVRVFLTLKSFCNLRNYFFTKNVNILVYKLTINCPQ